MGHGGRMGRVELLAVGESGPGGARMAEWDGGMFRSVIKHVGQRLVEHEVWRGLDVGGIEGRSLVE